MLIKRLSLNNFRNLNKINLDLHPAINVFTGPNGCGKTSLLESICFLALGRSFRTTSNVNSIINHNKDFASVSTIYYCQETEKQIKISTIKHRNQKKINKIGDTSSNNSQVAQLTPTQVIHEDSSKLIFAEPDLRRKFLDWLVFYSNKEYQYLWRNFNKALLQRNNLLKNYQKEKATLLEQIDRVFIDLSEKIKIAREKTWIKFKPILIDYFNKLSFYKNIPVDLDLFDGWRENLLDNLKLNFSFDLKQGFTSLGAHRADLLFKVDGRAAKEVLSRGQGKAISLMMILARANFINLIEERENASSVLLIDDLCAELDDVNSGQFIESLLEQSKYLQVLITGVDQQKLATIISRDCGKWFKIQESGEIIKQDMHLNYQFNDCI